MRSRSSRWLSIARLTFVLSACVILPAKTSAAARRMAAKTNVKSRYREHKINSVFQVKDAAANDQELSPSLLRSAKRTGQLTLAAKGLFKVPDGVWKINETPIERDIEIDFNRSSGDKPWWHSEVLSYLDVSSNAIIELSPDIKKLGDLTTLLLQDNALETVPSEIGELNKLTTLNLSRNKLSVLPKEFFKLIELKTLNLSHNNLETLEPDVGDLIMLNKLDLSHNNLTILPPGMGYLVRLTEIDLSHNKLTELPPDIVNLRELLKLDVTENELTALPPLGELRRMITLYCNHNNIEELPNFYGCSALREIHIANNHIKEVTEEFCEQMENLKILNIRDNKIEKLPENISLLQHLIRFDITNNNLSALPNNLGLLAHLQNLQLEGNRVLALRRGVIQGGTGKVLKFLRDKLSTEELDPENGCSNETKWPDKFAMRKTQTLLLAAKEITSIPDEVFEVAASENVHSIDIGKNKIKEFPISIVKVSESLTQLVLCCNQLTSVPRELSECGKLQYLELSKNQLTDLPIELGALKHMREIVISYNRFTKIPRCIYDMANLEILLAAENQITEINVSSDALAKLKYLTVFDLSNNDLSSVPPELGNFTQLRSLELFGNPFKQPRQAILEKGTLSVLSYLRDRIPT